MYLLYMQIGPRWALRTFAEALRNVVKLPNS
jgi:hypothetical protein